MKISCSSFSNHVFLIVFCVFSLVVSSQGFSLLPPQKVTGKSPGSVLYTIGVDSHSVMTDTDDNDDLYHSDSESDGTESEIDFLDEDTGESSRRKLVGSVESVCAELLGPRSQTVKVSKLKIDSLLKRK